MSLWATKDGEQGALMKSAALALDWKTLFLVSGNLDWVWESFNMALIDLLSSLVSTQKHSPSDASTYAYDSCTPSVCIDVSIP